MVGRPALLLAWWLAAQQLAPLQPAAATAVLGIASFDNITGRQIVPEVFISIAGRTAGDLTWKLMMIGLVASAERWAV